MNVSPSKWAPDELRRFYRAFHKYGSDFYKVSKMVGGGKAPEMCAGLWRRHQAYLNVDKKFQSEVGFLAIVRGMVERPSTAQSDQGGEGGGGQGDPPPDEEIEIEIPLEDIVAEATDGDGLSDAEINPTSLHASQQAAGVEGSEEADAAAAVVAMASPGGHRQSLGGSDGDVGLGGGRARRTPKRVAGGRSPGGHTTPGSLRKRPRSTVRDDDAFDYYDDASITESARKRRASQKRLDFESYQPAPTRRREAVEEKSDALMLLMFAAGGSSGDAPEQGTGDEGQLEREMGIESEEDDDLGVIVDDEADEDYREGRAAASGRGGRRTPHSTPAKGRNTGRPGSSHTTPRRSAGRIGMASPGGGLRYTMGSPGWMGGLGGDGDLMADFHGAGDISYLSSPGLPPQLPPGYVPSPKNPMPRLRRRKHPPERSATLISPLKGLFGRRQSLGASALIASSLGIPGASPLEDSARATASPAEHRLRHCLGARVRRWCFFEFFYPAVDRSWYMDNTMEELAAHVGVPRGTLLTRKEWNILRSSALGKPRRLSFSFLRESRASLEYHRQRARDLYNASSVDQMTAMSLPRPLIVGQRVTARHPATRQLHDGSVLTTAHNTYRVQFDRRELGVELVKDTEVMPSEPWENLPMATLASRPRLVLGGRLIVNGRPVHPAPSNIPHSDGALKGGSAAAGGGSRVAVPDPRVMAELATSLDRKEALLAQLRGMNDEAAGGAHNDPATGSPAAAFTQAYAQVTQQLKEVNEKVQAKLAELERAGTGNGPRATALLEELTGTAEGTALPAELLKGPITAQSLAAASLNEARRVMQNCKQRVVAEANVAAVARGDGAALEVIESDISSVLSGPLGPIIEGAVWSLVMLQQGSDKMVPPNALIAALDSSLLSVKPKAVVNAGLYTEVETAMKNLKLQLLAA